MIFAILRSPYTTQEDNTVNDSKCAAKLRAQLKRFLGELLPHFSRPKVSFLGDMIYGLMAGGDVKLSSICRAYRPRMALADHIPVVRVAVDERVAAPRLLVALHPCRRMSS